MQSGLTLAMPADAGNPPTGWTPMPDPADGGVPSPPFPMNLTAEEGAHLEAFDALDFEVFANGRPAQRHPAGVSGEGDQASNGVGGAWRAVGFTEQRRPGRAGHRRPGR